MEHNKKRAPLWEFFVNHSQFTLVVMITLLFLGLLAMFQLPRESNPEVDIPVAVITTVFPGGSAVDVEELVTNILEDKALTLEDVKLVTSTSRESVSSVVVEYDASADSERRIQDLKDAVDEVVPDLPEDANDPRVIKIRFSDAAIYTLAMSGPYTTEELKTYADVISDELERIPGLSSVSISGAQEDEVLVLVDRAKLDAYNLSLADVSGSISRANTDIPTGSITTGDVTYPIRLSGQLDTPEDVENIPVAVRLNAPILVRDVGTVVLGKSERVTESSLSIEGSIPEPSLTLNIFKQSGGNIVRVVDSVEEKVAELKAEYLPSDISFEVIQDQAQYVREDLANLIRSGLATVILVSLLLFIALGWREAILAALSIPFSFTIAFIFMQTAGSSINFLSLFSLILALGILIDSAIVIVEGMHRYTSRGLSSHEAAIQAIRDFHTPLIAGTLTTVFAFLPMLLMSGILGQFVKHIPITVTFVLLGSLLVALGFTTTAGAHWFKLRTSTSQTQKMREKIFGSLRKRYKDFLSDTLQSKARKRSIALFIVTGFILSLSLPISGLLRVNMFPANDQQFVFVDLSLPTGTPLAVTHSTLESAALLVADDPAVRSVSINSGSSAPTDNDGGGQGTHVGHLFINLKPASERDIKSTDFIQQYQNLYNTTINADISVGQVGEGPPSGAPIDVRISGQNLDILESIAQQIETLLANTPGTREVGSTVEETTGEFVLTIDRERAALYGLSTIQIAQELRNAVTGTEATVLRNGGDETPVMVRYALGTRTDQIAGEPLRTDFPTIQNITIEGPTGNVAIGQVTTASFGGARPSINHRNGDRILRVTSNVTTDSSAREVFQSVDSAIKSLDIPDGYDVQFGGETEDLEQSYTDLFRAMFLAVFLIAGLLVLQFGSFRQPLFVLTTIPFAFIGVFPGLVLVGQPLSFPGIIGVVALVGIVVNNAIILIDRTNRARRSGEQIFEAVLHATTSRLEPILLTTITTVVGMLPITLSNPLWGPLGYAIIF